MIPYSLKILCHAFLVISISLSPSLNLMDVIKASLFLSLVMITSNSLVMPVVK